MCCALLVSVDHTSEQFLLGVGLKIEVYWSLETEALEGHVFFRKLLCCHLQSNVRSTSQPSSVPDT